VPGRGLRRIFAKIHTFAISASFWTRADEHLHVFDAFCARQSTPAPDSACPASRQSLDDAVARDRAYKSLSGVDRTPPRTLDLTGARNHRRLPRARRARGHPSPCLRRPASRASPNPVQPSEKTVHASVKLPEQGIGVCITGGASPRSPDFTRPPVNVDLVILCSILWFLVHTVSTSPREAHRATWLN
jgi:hypothetical protein